MKSSRFITSLIAVVEFIPRRSAIDNSTSLNRIFLVTLHEEPKFPPRIFYRDLKQKEDLNQVIESTQSKNYTIAGHLNGG